MHKCKRKRTCRVCKRNYSRVYRKDGRYRDREIAYYNKIKNSLMYWAKTKVYIEVRSKRLKKPDSFGCADCGVRAEVYDHRDYLRPLDVEPVCRSCNKKRGPGLNKWERIAA